MNRTLCLSALCLIVLIAGAGIGVTDAEKAKLVERIRHGERAAILDAGNTLDQSLIQYLEPQISGRPTDPNTEAAQMALAKLGVKSHLDEIVAELITTNSVAYKFRRDRLRRGGVLNVDKLAKLETEWEAFKKLAYINNPSTVKHVASFLYDTYNPNEGNTSDVILPAPANLAVETLRQIVKDGPDTDSVDLWKKWWEQNKDKYP